MNKPEKTAVGNATHRLNRENVVFLGTGGRSQENRGAGFTPAFQDVTTGEVYASTLADGTAAPCHCTLGLPERAFIDRSAGVLQPGIVSGFLRDGRFYTREEAANAVQGAP